MATPDPLPPLIKRINEYLEKTGEKPSRFGRKVAQNSTLVDRIRSGNVTIRTYRKVVAFLDQQEAA